MAFVRGRERWTPLLGNSDVRHRSGGIYEQDEFKEIIHFETTRANRTNSALSLVICDVSGANGDKYEVGGVISEISRTVRRTDHVGWYGRHQIGVLLPATCQSAARGFVTKLAMGYPRDGIDYDVHSYPDTWLENQRITDRSERPRLRREPVATFTYKVPVWKRTLDIIGSTAGILFLLPLLAVVSLYIKSVSPGPVFYKSKRVGLARKEFTFLKFRTMHIDNDQNVHAHHAKDFIHSDKPMTKLDGADPRIIRGGRILRKVAVDELPQLFNILKGDMSLVGPRPCIPYEADEYEQWHAQRFSILPGLTGLWQVSGKNKLTFQEMIRLDIAYQNKMSLHYDLWIILRTFPTVAGLAMEGAKRRMGLRAESRRHAASGMVNPGHAEDV